MHSAAWLHAAQLRPCLRDLRCIVMLVLSRLQTATAPALIAASNLGNVQALRDK
jgi:hypothetical protein